MPDPNSLDRLVDLRNILLFQAFQVADSLGYLLLILLLLLVFINEHNNDDSDNDYPCRQ